MSGELMPHLGDGLLSRQGDRSSRRLQRDVSRAVDREHASALVRNARVEARALVAHTALVNSALLSAEEATLLQAVPGAEARLKAVADAYAIWAAGEVGRA